MKRVLSGLLPVLILSAAAEAQAPVYQAEQQYSLKLKLDALLRQEWTKDIFRAEDQSRRRGQVRPRLEIGVSKLLLAVGGDFNYSSDDNTTPPPGVPALSLIRDNYDSRDARLDLAFGSLRAARWLRLEGGRFPMPVGLTEMIWDRDLRPQGAALTLEARDLGGVQQLGLTALAAKGSHVFADDKTRLFLVSGDLTLAQAEGGSLQVVGSFLKFDRISGLELKIRRQNSRLAGNFIQEYEVLDAVARLTREGGFRTQLVADYCWNTAADEDNRGLWLALILGSAQSSRTRLEYTYARVDKDATLAAYATDDFFWSTGWQGHRLDIGVRTSEHSAFHAVGQLQRFKDSPRVEERDHWVKRLRLEARLSY